MVGVYSPTLSPWLAWTSYGLTQSSLCYRAGEVCVWVGGGVCGAAGIAQIVVDRYSGFLSYLSSFLSADWKDIKSAHYYSPRCFSLLFVNSIYCYSLYILSSEYIDLYTPTHSHPPTPTPTHQHPHPPTPTPAPTPTPTHPHPHTCIHAYVYIYIYIYVYIYVSIYICLYIYVCQCIYVYQ